MAAAEIQAFYVVKPRIYCYTTPGVRENEGLVKIGYTERQTPEERVREQTATVGVVPHMEWYEDARYTDGSNLFFRDSAFHRFLTRQKHVYRRSDTEWFRLGSEEAHRLFFEFASGGRAAGTEERSEYVLRQEQQEAVDRTYAYFSAGGTEFLWNAKPRFGKTLAAYDLVRKMHCGNVMIVTNRPSIADSWYSDFTRFIAWQTRYQFVSDNDIMTGLAGVKTGKLFMAANGGQPVRDCIAFESLQGLKRGFRSGDQSGKLDWISDTEFDLLIVDEAHEGVDTDLTSAALKRIRRKHTLHLSGTPFKALAGGAFREEQVFTWTYADEQERKRNWRGEACSPYEDLPQLVMFTYQMSAIICDRIRQGADLTADWNADYAFDLNEFFLTDEHGKFVHEEDVRKFLHVLTTQEKYPFSTPELREELAHTLWLLNRVASAKALARILRTMPEFDGYEIILAAGDGRLEDESVTEAALRRVTDKIRTSRRTITLSVGQLTVGVTVPEWSGVLMLCSMRSAAAYMQAAFRVQNPCVWDENGVRKRKETAYVFDFDPARTLVVYDEFASRLCRVAGSGNRMEQEEQIRRLLNFFPVLGEDEDGNMVELDAAAVLSIPGRIKSVEVVRRGFMSNFLFDNIGAVFGCPQYVQNILDKLTPFREEAGNLHREKRAAVDNVNVDESGEIRIDPVIAVGTCQDIFGKKIYSLDAERTGPADACFSMNTEDFIRTAQQDLAAETRSAAADILKPVSDRFKLKKSARDRLERNSEERLNRAAGAAEEQFRQKEEQASEKRDRDLAEAETEDEKSRIQADYEQDRRKTREEFIEEIKQVHNDYLENEPLAVTEEAMRTQEEDRKRQAESVLRERLRGFARTIPSFLMAYGDDTLTLASFDQRVEPDVFLEVTGITLEEFRILRDGCDFTDEDGMTRHFEGHLFNETVFNDSVKEFLRKRRELSDYFREDREESIFDYIPQQRTNQIFTPLETVTLQLDCMEESFPGCFDDPENTFLDPYMKSGLYITEIVKRLFRSGKMKQLFPNEKERIRHILTRQVYGAAPTRIIYLTATGYIFGFDPDMEIDRGHFACVDLTEAARRGKMGEELARYFGGT